MKRDWELYCSRPILAGRMDGNAREFIPVCVGYFLLVEIAAIFFVILDVIYKKSYETIPLILLLILPTYALFFGYRYLKKYLKNTKCLYYNDRICVKKYQKEDITITYDEIKECIKKKKIKIHNGRFEYPHKKGEICIYVSEDPELDELYQHMNRKCAVEMPIMEKREIDAVKRTGIGRICYSIVPLPFFFMELFLMGVLLMTEYGLQHTVKETGMYVIELLFSVKGNLFGIAGLFFVMLGLVLKVVFHFLAKMQFKEYEDIKVSLF